jgi:hypothetical protein
MADRVLLLSWGEVVRGREQHGLEVFNEAVAYYGSLEQEGRVEHFDLVLMHPNGFVDGFVLLHGTHAQIDAVREDERFQRLSADAGLVVDNLRQLEGWTGEGIAEAMGLYQQAIAAVPQMTAA